MKDYHVREVGGRLAGTTQALSATDAVLHFAEQMLKTTHVQENVLVFEVEIDDNIVRVSVHLEEHASSLGRDETLHFSEQELEPLETPLALTLTKKYRNHDGRITRSTK